MRGCGGGVHGCGEASVVAEGMRGYSWMCMVVGGACVVVGGVHGCGGACVVVGGLCVVARGRAWLPGGRGHA